MYDYPRYTQAWCINGHLKYLIIELRLDFEMFMYFFDFQRYYLNPQYQYYHNID